MSGYLRHLIRIWAMFVIVAYGGGVATGQPIEPMAAVGPYSGGGVSLSGDDVRRIAWDGGEPGAIGGGGPRGGDGGNVLIVECGGAFGFSTIQGAIDAAVDGDVVVVLPNDCTAEGRWFENLVVLNKSIRVQSAEPADALVVDATIIDGDRLGSVLRIENDAASGTIIDGLTLTNGIGFDSSTGGGITCYLSAPMIRRCAIRENFSVSGGGIRCISLESPIVEGCRFVDNAAIGQNGNGAAVSASQSAFPRFRDCDFSGHSGASLSVNTGWPPSCSGESCHSFENCRFENNDCSTLIVGDQLAFDGCDFVGNTGTLLVGAGIEFRDCRIEGNDAGAATLFDVTDGLRMTDCEVVGNAASTFLQISSALFQIRGCRFENNVIQGGLIFSSGDIASSIVDCEFVGNDLAGSVILSAGGRDLWVEGCTFRQNRAFWVILLGNTAIDPFIGRCEFRDNEGGAILGASYMIRDCLIVGNRSGWTTLIHSPAAYVLGCTIVGNRGAVLSRLLQNSIVYNNRGDYPDGVWNQVYRAEVSYSNVQFLGPNSLPPNTTPDAPGNIAFDPRFVDPGHWDDMGTPADLTDDVFVSGDYHLLPDSPCIDAGGIPEFVSNEGATDFDGEPRVMSCRVDMGVDEFTQDDVDVVGDFDGDGVVTVDDLPAFVDVTLAPLGLGVCRADINGDGYADGLDVAAMVTLLLGS